jgi:CRP/FNR family cyclic AMP-dependent transcriptional regulator
MTIDIRRSALGRPILTEALLDVLVPIGRIKSFPKGTLVVMEGEPADTLYIVLDGKLKVFVSDESGHEAVLNELGPAEYFGELMLANANRTASVKTLVPTRLCMIRRAEFEAIIATRPDIAFHLIQTLIYRVGVLTHNVQRLALMDVYGRVAHMLLDLAEEIEGSTVVLRMSQQKIAERVGASRSMINRILKDLVRGGYISVTRQRIELRKELPRRW